jgi:dTDP-4-amino-4,6-dideoxygalactose transaminase
MKPSPIIAAPAVAGGMPVRKDFLVFGSPQILDDEINEVVDSMRSSWLGTGPKVAQFEEAFRAYKGARFAVALNSCTAGLHLSCVVAGFGPGDEVITTPMTFCATANAIIHSGATPVFADCDRATFNLDPREIERKMTPRTKGIVPVHFAGRPCDMKAIMALVERHRVKVIEDCAHAIETEYRGAKAGLLGDLAAFSFYATKNVVTGEGGMVLTREEEDADRLKVLALHGMTKDAWKRFGDEGYKHYQVVYPGFKYNMMDLQAAIGIHQLKRVEANWVKRKSIWDRYQQALADLPVFLPAEPEPETRHAYHLYTLLLDLEHLKVSRDFVLDALVKENIGVGVHYIPLHTQPYYAKTYSLQPPDYPQATWIGERTISLPLSPKLSDQDVDEVIRAITRLLKYYAK